MATAWIEGRVSDTDQQLYGVFAGPTIQHTWGTGETVTERPCGCDVRWPCMCRRERIQPDGTFLQLCRGCRIEFRGRRYEAMSAWHAHIRTDEHAQTWEVERYRIHAEDAEAERVKAGQLW